MTFLCAPQAAGPSTEFPPFPTKPAPRCDHDAPSDWRARFCPKADPKKFHDCVGKAKRRNPDKGKGQPSNPDICVKFAKDDGAWYKDTRQWIGWVMLTCCKKLTGSTGTDAV